MSCKKEFLVVQWIFSIFATQFLEILFPTFESRGTEFASFLLQRLNAKSESLSPWNNTHNLLENKYIVPSPATAPKIDC